MNPILAEKLQNVPDKPGCYLWKDAQGTVIYVGKAINLYNRVHQYFLLPQNQRRTQLAQNIFDLDYIITKNNNEAFVLENNLIKKYQPYYNVLLKDGSGYPYILVTKDQNPQILYTRQIKKNAGKYYGPITPGVKNKYDIYNLLQTLFPLRKCKTIPKEKCLYYDIHQCVGPCINVINPETYKEIKKNIDDFFHGKYGDVLEKLKQEEEELANNLNFEQAQEKKELIQAVLNLQTSQNVQLLSTNNLVNFVAYKVIENKIGIVVFSYVDGKLLTKYDSIQDIYDDNDAEVVTNFLMQYYEQFELPTKIYAALDDENVSLLENNLHVKIENPKKGVMKEIMLTALENANVLINNSLKTWKSKIARTKGANEQLRILLQMDQLKQIDLFDNSHIDNVDRVGAVVVYENGEKKPSLYRKFIIKDENAHDDLSYMKEVLTRRYSKLLKENEALPDLVILDGGQLQVKVAITIFEQLKIRPLVKIIGLKKDDHHRTNCIVLDDMSEIPLDKKSNLYFFLLNMQEEVHRFAISFFRDRHTKSLLATELDKVKGLGVKRRNLLLQTFHNINEIKQVSKTELTQILPKNVVEELLKVLNKE